MSTPVVSLPTGPLLWLWSWDILGGLLAGSTLALTPPPSWCSWVDARPRSPVLPVRAAQFSQSISAAAGGEPPAAAGRGGAGTGCTERCPCGSLSPSENISFGASSWPGARQITEESSPRAQNRNRAGAGTRARTGAAAPCPRRGDRGGPRGSGGSPRASGTGGRGLGAGTGAAALLPSVTTPGGTSEGGHGAGLGAARGEPGSARRGRGRRGAGSRLGSARPGPAPPRVPGRRAGGSLPELWRRKKGAGGAARGLQVPSCPAKVTPGGSRRRLAAGHAG